MEKYNFKENTDIDYVRKVAIKFLNKEPVSRGFFVSHPFTNMETVVCNNESEYFNIFKNKKKWNQWKKERTEIINGCSLDSIELLMEKGFYYDFLLEIKDYLSKEDFNSFLAEAYVLVEQPSSYKDEIIELFSNSDRDILMNEEEKKIYEILPDVITVYRGVQYEEHASGISWTLSEEQAEWFADRFDGTGFVFSAKIKKEDIFAYFDSREEEEIVLNPEKLFDVNEI